MKEKIDFDWSEKLEIKDKKESNKVIETFPSDKLERSKYAKFLTQYLISSSYDESKSIDLNYVLNLNSEWGAGKSYFLRRWAYDLKSRHPVVYIDAWKQDYSEDPLMTVISSLISQLREQAGIDEDSTTIKAPKKLIGLLKAAAPSLARGLSKRYLGIDPVQIMESDDEEEVIGDAKDENGNPIDMGLAASKVVEQLINEHDSKAAAIRSLKDNVKKWIEIVVQKKELSNPAFVFIDELDRCRPSYAVEMLETIKHIFDIPGVVFVVATDTEQLQHAVKAIYGVGFDARVYLSRFFNSRFSLKAPNLENLLEVHCDTKKLSKEYFDELGIIVWPVNDDLSLTINNITAVLNAFSLSPRTAIQVTERIIAIISHLQDKAKIDIVMLTTLLCIREKDESLYEKIITKTYDIEFKGKPLALNRHLNKLFRIGSESLRFEVDKEKCISSFNQLVIGRIRVGMHSVSYNNYLSKILDVFIFGRKRESAILAFSNKNAPDLQVIEIIKNEISELSSGEHQNPKGKIGGLWLEYMYFLEELDKIEIEFYQNLVELGSTIDWLIEDDNE